MTGGHDPAAGNHRSYAQCSRTRPRQCAAHTGPPAGAPVPQPSGTRKPHIVNRRSATRTRGDGDGPGGFSNLPGRTVRPRGARRRFPQPTGPVQRADPRTTNATARPTTGTGAYMGARPHTRSTAARAVIRRFPHTISADCRTSPRGWHVTGARTRGQSRIRAAAPARVPLRRDSSTGTIPAIRLGAP